MVNKNNVLVIQTGGTIDKEYPRSIGGYAFELRPETSPASKDILHRARVDMNTVRFVCCCRKDSQEILAEDLENLFDICQTVPESKIIITHGSDTILNTAKCLFDCSQLRQLRKRIVLTGAFLPECFKNSDADFNVGMAWSLATFSDDPGVFVCIDGLCGPVHCFDRDLTSGKFALN